MKIFILHCNVSSDDVGYFSSEEKARQYGRDVLSEGIPDFNFDRDYSIRVATLDEPEAF